MEELLKLCEMNAASGNEEEIASFIAGEAKKYADNVYIDSMGNVIAVKKGTEGRRNILLSAHTDEVGGIVSSIDDEGYVLFRTVGGIDPLVLSSKRVVINGNIGIIASKAIHLMSKEEKEKRPSLSGMYIDMGVRSREEAEKLVRKGDYIHFYTKSSRFGNGYLKAKAFDDRCGCFILLSLLKNRYRDNVYFTFTVQEEIGLRGSKCASRFADFDEAVVIECTTCLDIPETKEKDISTRTKSGAAVTIVDSATYADKSVREKICKTAERIQFKNVAAGGNDAGSVSLNNIKTAAISVPARYIHSPVSVVAEDDVWSAMKILENYLRGEEND